MTRGAALSEAETVREAFPKGIAPLALGDPQDPALTLRDDGSGGAVVEAAHPVVLVGPLGMAAIRHWAEGCQAKPDRQGANRSKSAVQGLELWTATGITKETGIPTRTIRAWVQRDDFPRPFADPVGGSRIWEADAIRSWLLTSRPKPGPKRRP